MRLLALSIVLAAFVAAAMLCIGGRYSIAGTQNYSFVVDRWTGHVRVCYPDKCADVKPPSAL
jgi:hypothetical protein